MPDLDNDIGRLTFSMRASAKDICEVWFRMPGRRADYGERELTDIREVVIGLSVLLREIEKTKQPKLVAIRV